jgi:chromosome segregation ATPase
MEAAFRKMSKYRDIYSDMEKAIDRQNCMNLELTQRNAHIAFLEQHQQQTIEDHEKRAANLKRDIARLEDQLSNTKAEAIAQHKQAIEKQKVEEARELLREELEAEEQKTNELSGELARLTANASRTQESLEHCRSQLKEWDNKLSVLWDIDLHALLVDTTALPYICID